MLHNSYKLEAGRVTRATADAAFTLLVGRDKGERWIRPREVIAPFDSIIWFADPFAG